jgi:saccharopine dehydrogenase (NAD+, L-lysine-forming)
MSGQALWLRCEKKEFERRSALTPTTARKLIEAGFQVSVERDEQRIFDDEDFEKSVWLLPRVLHDQYHFRVGCTLVANNSWPSAPISTPIIGLKELEVLVTPLPHTHIQFAHCYKNQVGWAEVLARFAQGKGTLYDLEFLVDEKGRRVAAFGYHAGFAGAAAGVLAAVAKRKGDQLASLKPYENEECMITHIRESLGDSASTLRVLVMGALGRCGRGAVDLCKKIGLIE